MTNEFRTLIVPSDQAEIARTIAATLDPANCQGMFTTPLSPTGDAPATHYISSGYINSGFANLVPFAVYQQEGDPPEWVQTDYEPGDAFTTLALCIETGLEYTLEEIEDLYASADVTAEDPWVALGRLELQIVRPVEPASQEPEAEDAEDTSLAA